jgi:hypothetical protein
MFSNLLCQSCYELSFTPSFFLNTSVDPAPVVIHLVLPITPDCSEKDIADTLERVYTDLTNFLTMHHRTPNSDLLFHQPKPHGARTIGSMPHPYPNLFPSHHRYPHSKDMTPQPFDSYPDLRLPSDMDTSPKIVTLSD